MAASISGSAFPVPGFDVGSSEQPDFWKKLMIDDDGPIGPRTGPLTDHANRPRATPDERAKHWLKKNAEAIAYYNAYIDKNGLPLEAYRMF
jgi:Post-segregation antitoxin CcdA